METNPSKLYCRQDSKSKEENISLSERIKKEVEELVKSGSITERAIRCTACNRVIMTAFSDSLGHISLKCKCGVISEINLGTCCTRILDEESDFRI